MRKDEIWNPKIQSQNAESNLNTKQRNIMTTTSEHIMAGQCKNPTDWHIKTFDYFPLEKMKRLHEQLM